MIAQQSADNPRKRARLDVNDNPTPYSNSFSRKGSIYDVAALRYTQRHRAEHFSKAIGLRNRLELSDPIDLVHQSQMVDRLLSNQEPKRELTLAHGNTAFKGTFLLRHSTLESPKLEHDKSTAPVYDASVANRVAHSFGIARSRLPLSRLQYERQHKPAQTLRKRKHSSSLRSRDRSRSKKPNCKRESSHKQSHVDDSSSEVDAVASSSRIRNHTPLSPELDNSFDLDAGYETLLTSHADETVMQMPESSLIECLHHYSSHYYHQRGRLPLSICADSDPHSHLRFQGEDYDEEEDDGNDEEGDDVEASEDQGQQDQEARSHTQSIVSDSQRRKIRQIHNNSSGIVPDRISSSASRVDDEADDAEKDTDGNVSESAKSKSKGKASTASSLGIEHNMHQMLEASSLVALAVFVEEYVKALVDPLLQARIAEEEGGPNVSFMQMSAEEREKALEEALMDEDEEEVGEEEEEGEEKEEQQQRQTQPIEKPDPSDNHTTVDRMSSSSLFQYNTTIRQKRADRIQRLQQRIDVFESDKDDTGFQHDPDPDHDSQSTGSTDDIAKSEQHCLPRHQWWMPHHVVPLLQLKKRETQLEAHFEIEKLLQMKKKNMKKKS